MARGECPVAELAFGITSPAADGAVGESRAGVLHARGERYRIRRASGGVRRGVHLPDGAHSALPILDRSAAALTYVPGTQFVHGVQVSAFAIALNPPLAHAMHVRSVVGLPVVRTSSPGTQLVIGAQAVAELAS